MFSFFPMKRLSTMHTSNPFSISKSAVVEPMNPAPPVTRTFSGIFQDQSKLCKNLLCKCFFNSLFGKFREFYFHVLEHLQAAYVKPEVFFSAKNFCKNRLLLVEPLDKLSRLIRAVPFLEIFFEQPYCFRGVKINSY